MKTDPEILSTFGTLHELWPHLREVEFLATVRRMQETDGRERFGIVCHHFMRSI
ncbi:MAG: hypothetical protein JF616_16690 [Fibrobacteres bacterium]|nr:hypothetical protein [Fibrobacterota bacterium]